MFAAGLAESIAPLGFDAVVESDPVRVLTLVADGSFDVALVDLVMPTVRGTDLAEKISLCSPDTRVLILTGHADLDSAIAAIQSGAVDYLRKDRVDSHDLKRALREASARSWLSRENRRLLRSLQDSNDVLEALNDFAAVLAGESVPAQALGRLVDAARRLTGAQSARAVLLKATDVEGFVISEAAGDGADVIRGVRLKRNEGIALSVVETERAVVLEDPQAHGRYLRRCDELPGDKPGFVCVPLRRGLVQGALSVRGARAGSGFSSEAVRLVERLAHHGAMALDNALHQERAVNFFTHASDMLVRLLDGVDVSFTGHSRRVAALSDLVTRRLGLGDEARRDIHFGALLHDIGKMQVGLEILGSVTLLTEAQRERVRLHPALGVEILRPITLWEEILPVVHCHHERWDGKGYPHGMTGEDAPLGARVVAIAEVFEAMLRGGPWRSGREVEDALSEIESQAGQQFDPRLARLFVSEFRQHGAEALGETR